MFLVWPAMSNLLLVRHECLSIYLPKADKQITKRRAGDRLRPGSWSRGLLRDGVLELDDQLDPTASDLDAPADGDCVGEGGLFTGASSNEALITTRSRPPRMAL